MGAAVPDQLILLVSLVDIPPILPSADAELLVDVVGQVFLVAEAGMVSKRDVSRVRAVLEQLDPGAVGLIVNGYAREVLNKLPMEFAVEAQKLLAISLEGSVG